MREKMVRPTQPTRLMHTILCVSYEFVSGNFAEVVIVKTMLAQWAVEKQQFDGQNLCTCNMRHFWQSVFTCVTFVFSKKVIFWHIVVTLMNSSPNSFFTKVVDEHFFYKKSFHVKVFFFWNMVVDSYFFGSSVLFNIKSKKINILYMCSLKKKGFTLTFLGSGIKTMFRVINYSCNMLPSKLPFNILSLLQLKKYESDSQMDFLPFL